MDYLRNNRLAVYPKRILFIVLLTIFSMLCGCSSKDKNQVTSADGVVISYDVQGEGAPALVFVHGWSCDRSFWKYQVAEFSKSNKVITIDLGGHGQSGLNREDWTIEAFSGDVAAVINKLNLEKVVLVGHSMGGSVIIEAARQLPDRVIALIGADTFHDIESGYDQEEIRKIVSALKQDYILTTRSFVSQMFPPDADAELVEWTIDKMASADPQVAISSMENLPKYSIKEAVKDVFVPICSISSDFWPTDFETNKKYVQSFEVKMMTGVGHFVMLEDAETFNRLLRETIDELSE